MHSFDAPPLPADEAWKSKARAFVTRLANEQTRLTREYEYMPLIEEKMFLKAILASPSELAHMKTAGLPFHDVDGELFYDLERACAWLKQFTPNYGRLGKGVVIRGKE